jgi:hypothetical protein
MPGFNQNGSLHCGRNMLTIFGHGRTLASGSRQDKRAGSKQDAMAEDCVAAQWPGERACAAQSRSRRATYMPRAKVTSGKSQ